MRSRERCDENNSGEGSAVSYVLNSVFVVEPPVSSIATVTFTASRTSGSSASTTFGYIFLHMGTFTHDLLIYTFDQYIFDDFIPYRGDAIKL